MKNLLTAFTALLLTFSTNTIYAQDAKAKGILDAASKKMSGLKSAKASFALSLKNAAGKVTGSKKGTFMMKGQKYRVTMPSQEIICDGSTVWTFMKDANEVQVSSYNPSEQSISPTKLFSNFYDKEFSYRYLAAKTVGGKACDVIELIPTGKGKQFSKVELAIDKTSTITGGTVYEKNGNRYEYTVSGFTPNAAVSDASFTWDAAKNAKVEVIDLR